MGHLRVSFIFLIFSFPLCLLLWSAFLIFLKAATKLRWMPLSRP